MSTYYNYYLEQRMSDGWSLLCAIDNIDSDDNCMIYWHTGSYGSDFVDKYQNASVLDRIIEHPVALWKCK